MEKIGRKPIGEKKSSDFDFSLSKEYTYIKNKMRREWFNKVKLDDENDFWYNSRQQKSILLAKLVFQI